MDRQFTLGYNEGLTTAFRALTNLANDLRQFDERDKLDADFIAEVVEGLKYLYLDVEES